MPDHTELAGRTVLITGASTGDVLKLIWWAGIGMFRSRASLEAEILTLRHELTILRRKSPGRWLSVGPTA
jgi:hypothetical protein